MPKHTKWFKCENPKCRNSFKFKSEKMWKEAVAENELADKYCSSICEKGKASILSIKRGNP